jgi:hypothetical protein
MSLATKSCDALKQVGEEAPKFISEWLCSQEGREEAPDMRQGGTE